jgi:5-methylcytosine-specific restriction enzyme subunit McrC
MNLITLREYQILPPRKDKTLNEIERKSVDILKSLKLEEADQKLHQRLQDEGILTIDENKQGLRIKAESHIGVAQFSNFSVTIIPKFSNIGRLVELIDYVYDLDLEVFPESETEFLGEKNMLSEIIISTFVKHTEKLLKRGMVRSYTNHQSNSPFLRGKLIFQQQIINDSKTKLEFACEHDEFEYDNLENQILLYCLERCYYITINNDRKKEIRRMMGLLEGLVNHKEISSDDLKMINYNQMNQHYKKVHELCKLIVNSIRITDFYEQKSRFVNSFFVDMNAVFEKFVFKLFHKYYPLPSKEQQRYASWEIESSGKKYNIIPDILIYDKNRYEIETIIDTKYKDDLSESDRFQIAFYIRDYDKMKGYAILPKTQDSKLQTLKATRQNIEIKICFIDIDEVLTLIYSKDNHKDKIKNLLLELIPIN